MLICVRLKFWLQSKFLVAFIALKWEQIGMFPKMFSQIAFLCVGCIAIITSVRCNERRTIKIWIWYYDFETYAFRRYANGRDVLVWIYPWILLNKFRIHIHVLHEMLQKKTIFKKEFNDHRPPSTYFYALSMMSDTWMYVHIYRMQNCVH